MAKLKNPMKKGARLERKSRDFFEANGALVWRAAGSRGVADLLVVPIYGKGQGTLVLVRANRWPSPADQKDAIEIGKRYGLGVLLHRWNDGRPKEPQIGRIL